MASTDALRDLADHFNILPSFYDANGHEHIMDDATRRAFLAANGVDVSSDESIAHILHTLRSEAENRWFPVEIIVEASTPHDANFGLGAAWQIRIWGGSEILEQGQAGDHISLPALAPDVYDMRIEVAGRVENVRILASPKQLPLLADVAESSKIWGITAALYGLQSARSSGMGDYADLAALCELAATNGAAFVGINPVHNMGYADKSAISPYSPSHRGFYNTGHIALDKVPGLAQSQNAKSIVADFGKSFGAPDATAPIDYSRHKQAHQAALEKLFAVFLAKGDDATSQEFKTFVDAQGVELVRFSKFETLSEIHGSDWRNWPNDLQETQPDRLEFHCWLQWVADVQLSQAQKTAQEHGAPLGLYLDLSVGPRRDGAESWCEQATIATGVAIGAPPDHLGPAGQNWDLAAYSPTKLQAAGYAPLRRVLAQTMRHAGVIRIDHVLGINRSYWIPDDGSAGGYIRQPFDALIAIIKIEAHKHNTVVIGEDLGLVPDGFRDTMQAHGFYGYSVLQYEKNHDGSFRDPKYGSNRVLSCFGTHDTPTIKGFEAARDIELWADLNILDQTKAAQMRADRHNDLNALRSLVVEDSTDFVDEIHGILAGSASEMICLQLDDILAQAEPQNLPGTIDEYPNWRRRHESTIEEFVTDDIFAPVTKMMRKNGRST